MHKFLHPLVTNHFLWLTFLVDMHLVVEIGPPPSPPRTRPLGGGDSPQPVPSLSTADVVEELGLPPISN